MAGKKGASGRKPAEKPLKNRHTVRFDDEEDSMILDASGATEETVSEFIRTSAIDRAKRVLRKPRK